MFMPMQTRETNIEGSDTGILEKTQIILCFQQIIKCFNKLTPEL